jgi:adenylate cyclase
VAERRVRRRLAAILAADVVGYSALMQRAEETTYAEFERLMRELIEPKPLPPRRATDQDHR